MNVFISYSYKDSEVAHALADAIRRFGSIPFIYRQLSPGTDWTEAISQEIDRASLFVLLWSEAAHASESVRREIELAQRQETFILIIQIDKTVPLPTSLPSTSVLDLTAWDQTHRLNVKVLAGLERELKRSQQQILEDLVNRILNSQGPSATINENAEITPGVEAEAPRESTAPSKASETERVVNTWFQEARIIEGVYANDPIGIIHHDLIAGRDYALMVQVGPLDKRTIVVQNEKAVFPEDLLPPAQDGYVLDVLLVCEDFEPSLVSGQIWVPRGSGRSTAIVNGHRVENDIPLALRFAPKQDSLRLKDRGGVAHGRLNVYYENNLIQSASITVGVGQSEDIRQVAEFDFVLTHSLDQAEALKTRRLQLPGDTEPREYPVALNITMNDVNGSYRIIVKGQHNLELAMSYDPGAWGRSLDRSRTELGNCLYKRDAKGNVRSDTNGKVTSPYGFDNSGKKSRPQFDLDLFELAKIGSKLIGDFLAALSSDLIVLEKLEDLLSSRQTIQAINAGSQNYAVPWNLFYYPQVDVNHRNDWKACRVIDDWESRGFPPLTSDGKCPYHAQCWLDPLIICPYKLWGFRHIIEQLPSIKNKISGDSARSAANLTLATATFVDAKIDVSVGVAYDKTIGKYVDSHIETLRRLDTLNVSTTPAVNANQVQTMLKSPELVYFLCHAAWSKDEEDYYLQVNPRNARLDSNNYVFANVSLVTWGTAPKEKRSIDRDAWWRIRPLVFINACGSNKIRPGVVANFPGSFAFLGAAGTLGTEVEIDVRIATRVAESVFKKLAVKSSPAPRIAEVLAEVRQELLQDGNLLGLAYTWYGVANLYIEWNAPPSNDRTMS
jgi:hypothetical protein